MQIQTANNPSVFTSVAHLTRNSDSGSSVDSRHNNHGAGPSHAVQNLFNQTQKGLSETIIQMTPDHGQGMNRSLETRSSSASKNANEKTVSRQDSETNKNCNGWEECVSCLGQAVCGFMTTFCAVTCALAHHSGE